MRRALLVLGLFALGGCECGGGAQEEAPEPAKPLFPLAVGNWWAYLSSDSSGAAVDSETTRVLADTTYEGKEGFVVTGNLMGTYDTTVIFLDGDTLRLVYKAELGGQPLMEAVAALVPETLRAENVGDRWLVFEAETTGLSYPPFIDSTDTVSARVWATVLRAETTSTHAGDFWAFEIHYADTIFKNGALMITTDLWTWYSPGTGPVKKDYDDEAGQDPTTSLEDYYLVE